MTGYNLIALAVFGAAGALMRFGVSKVAPRIFGTNFPYGTLVVNVLGCLAIGFFMELGTSSEALPKWLKTAITVGFLGAFTTFSAFGYETLLLIRQGSIWSALASVSANLVAGILAVGLGLVICKAITN